ncbi:MAG: hypothetical protein QXD96_00795 [Pyrobaculum sp.]
MFRITFADLGGKSRGSERGFSFQHVQIYISRGFPSDPWGRLLVL